MNTRIFVRKKKAFNIEEVQLCNELNAHLGTSLAKVELYNIYDIFGAEDKDVTLLKTKVLAEAVTDTVFDDVNLNGACYLAIEGLAGQYDQRADSAEQCIMLLNNKQEVKIKSARLLVFHEQKVPLDKIKKYLINPVEMQEKDLTVLSYDVDVNVESTVVLTDFCTLGSEGLKSFLQNHSLAMTLADLTHVQDYFKSEKRAPTLTEIKVLDTYWSDHCRHTTFETMLQNVVFEKGGLSQKIESVFREYLTLRADVHQNRKPVTLMDMATIAGKKLRKDGFLDDMEISDEINACSIEIDVDNNGVTEKWLLMFKNETHNHPTEIEPFGGASTCIGGAIRDPLSGRSYVFQAMRLTGAGDITAPVEQVLSNKLPQSAISKGAAQGYSSYGNQIGLATTYVKELFHDGYVAKRMEVGAVVGAVPKNFVRRDKPSVGDIVVLLGGATGRDGIGGATGSSKEHNSASLTKCGSEVQKGNAPMERRMQRLFRNPEATQLIKKANDFGAGGVSVAIGEIADGISINLDAVPTKYSGLSGMEIAISESQERMAVLIEADKLQQFVALCHEENLGAIQVATVTAENRLVMHFKGEKIVDISRDFLDTNGVRGTQDVVVVDTLTVNPFVRTLPCTVAGITENLQDKNVASQQGLVQMFDNSIGRTTVLMPFGGKYQASENEGGVQKIPVFGKTDTVSAITYGFNPALAEKSPFLGGSYSVVEALSRLVAMGIDYKKARLSCQEYFEKLGTDSKKWGKVVAALSGVIEAQMAFKTPAIGGKDSMSGTFNTADGKQITVPPTLITFAVSTGSAKNVISTDFKKAGNYLYLVKNTPNEDYSVNYDTAKKNFDFVLAKISDKTVLSAATVKMGGLAEVLFKNAFGNKIGFEVTTKESVFDLAIGSLVVESQKELSFENAILLGKTLDCAEGILNGVSLSLEDARKIHEAPYAKIYPYLCDEGGKDLETPLCNDQTRVYSKAKVAKPKVILPVFFGTNCEYDGKAAWDAAGAESEIYVLNNLDVESLQKSIDTLAKKIENAQILMLSGGFSAGDEPDGSGKFIANVLCNEKINAAVQKLLANDGLILGVCNGFQALIKSGLLPYGDISQVDENSPTLFRNNINRHVSKFGYTKITSNKSPWLKSFKTAEIHSLPYSHGEGKFVINEEQAKELFENGQVATQYCTEAGVPTMQGEVNFNGSYYAIEGITSKCGRIFGKMGHSERYTEDLFKNISGNKDQNIFRNGVAYFTGEEFC